MEAILALAGKLGLGKAGMFVGGALGGIGLMIASPIIKKIFKGFIGKFFGSKVKEILALDIKDPKIAPHIKLITLSCVLMAEQAIPDSGMGEAKKKYVEEKLKSLLGDKLSDLVGDMIEIAVNEMNTALQGNKPTKDMFIDEVNKIFP